MLTKLMRDGAVPLHTQIAEALRLRIQNNEFKDQENLPSERELAESYSVCRVTVREALRKLRLEGLIYNERGVGTFVNNRKIDVHTRSLTGFSEEMAALGFAPSSRVVAFNRELCSEEVMRDLELCTGAEVVRLERLRLANGEAMAFETTYLPAHLFTKLEEFDLTGNSLYQILVENYNLQLHHAEDSLEAKSATRIIAQQLGIKPGTPVLDVHRIAYTESNQPIESTHTTYRADRYRATFYLSKNT